VGQYVCLIIYGTPAPRKKTSPESKLPGGRIKMDGDGAEYDKFAVKKSSERM
jgi:hypothetical protein